MVVIKTVLSCLIIGCALAVLNFNWDSNNPVVDFGPEDDY